MSTVERAMQLLNYFENGRREIGLSEFRMLAGRDKATTYRHLCALESVGMIEQNLETRRYRIGPAVLRLARLREDSMPRLSGLRAALQTLSKATQETAHGSMLEGTVLRSMGYQEASEHSTRVIINIDVLPLHATASGLAVLAFSGPDLRKAALEDVAQFTAYTPASEAALDDALSLARATGFAVSDQGFELGVHGIAAPLFDESTKVAGAIAVAVPVGRMTAELGNRIRHELSSAARDVTKSWGGTLPDALLAAWSINSEKV